MARKYIKMREMEEEIIKTQKTGLTVRETAKLYGLDNKQVENLITRHNRRLKEKEAGIPCNANLETFIGIKDNSIKGSA